MATEPTTNPLDAKIAEARADEAYLSPMHERHSAAVANVARLFSQRYPESVAVEQPADPLAAAAREDVQPALPSTEEARRVLFEEMDLGELRSRAGVHVALPSNAQFDPVHEGNFLAFVINEGVPAQVATRITEYYADRVLLGGNEITEQDYEDFRQRFAKDLRPDQIEQLIRWHKTEVMSSDR